MNEEERNNEMAYQSKMSKSEGESENQWRKENMAMANGVIMKASARKERRENAANKLWLKYESERSGA
jgi:hypothetical protein